MQKFKSLNLTYNRLVSEVDMLTTKSIVLNSEFNTINTKVKAKRKEYEEVKVLIKEEYHRNQAQMVNEYKEYKLKLDNKEQKQTQKDNEHKEEEKALKRAIIEIEESKLGISTREILLNALQVQISTKCNNLEQKEEDINKANGVLKSNKLKWEKKLKNNTKLNNDLEANIVIIRKEEEQNKQDFELRRQETVQTKVMLEEWEKRLIDKEQLIASEMRALISAREFNNKK